MSTIKKTLSVATVLATITGFAYATSAGEYAKLLPEGTSTTLAMALSGSPLGGKTGKRTFSESFAEHFKLKNKFVSNGNGCGLFCHLYLNNRLSVKNILRKYFYFWTVKK